MVRTTIDVDIDIWIHVVTHPFTRRRNRISRRHCTCDCISQIEQILIKTNNTWVHHEAEVLGRPKNDAASDAPFDSWLSEDESQGECCAGVDCGSSEPKRRVAAGRAIGDRRLSSICRFNEMGS